MMFLINKNLIRTMRSKVRRTEKQRRPWRPHPLRQAPAWVANLKLCSYHLLSFLKSSHQNPQDRTVEMSWADMVKRLEELNWRTKTRSVQNNPGG